MTELKLPKYGTPAWKKLIVTACAKWPADRTERENAALAFEFAEKKDA